MKLLLNSCISLLLKSTVGNAGHAVTWAGDWPADPGDEEILARAHSEGRALVTLEKDFGDLAIVRGVAHSGLVRLAGVRLAAQADAILRVLAQHDAQLRDGGVATIEPSRVRTRVAREP